MAEASATPGRTTEIPLTESATPLTVRMKNDIYSLPEDWYSSLITRIFELENRVSMGADTTRIVVRTAATSMEVGELPDTWHVDIGEQIDRYDRH